MVNGFVMLQIISFQQGVADSGIMHRNTSKVWKTDLSVIFIFSNTGEQVVDVFC